MPDEKGFHRLLAVSAAILAESPRVQEHIFQLSSVCSLPTLETGQHCTNLKL